MILGNTRCVHPVGVKTQGPRNTHVALVKTLVEAIAYLGPSPLAMTPNMRYCQGLVRGLTICQSSLSGTVHKLYSSCTGDGAIRYFVPHESPTISLTTIVMRGLVLY